MTPVRSPASDRSYHLVEFPDRPVFGVLPVKYGSQVVDLDILFFRGRMGQHVWAMRDRPADVSAHSADFLRRRLGPGELG